MVQRKAVLDSKASPVALGTCAQLHTGAGDLLRNGLTVLDDRHALYRAAMGLTRLGRSLLRHRVSLLCWSRSIKSTVTVFTPTQPGRPISVQSVCPSCRAFMGATTHNSTIDLSQAPASACVRPATQHACIWSGHRAGPVDAESHADLWGRDLYLGVAAAASKDQ